MTTDYLLLNFRKLERPISDSLQDYRTTYYSVISENRSGLFLIVLLIASRENTKKIFFALRAKTVMQVVMQSWESKLELFVSKGILPDSKEIRGTGVMRIFLLLLLFCSHVGAATTEVEVVHPVTGGIAYKKCQRR